MTIQHESYQKWRNDFESDYDQKPSYFQVWQAATTEANKRIAELENEVARLNFISSTLKANIDEHQASNNTLREALDMLVITKEYKDKQGKDAVYKTMRTNAWNVAEQALSATPSQSLALHDNELLERAMKVAVDMPMKVDEIHQYRASDDCKAMAWDISHAIRALKEVK